MKEISVFLYGIIISLNSFSQAGNPDNTFGSNGITTTSFGPIQAHGRSMVIQNDGKIIMVGYRSDGAMNEFAISRYNMDGSADFSFDTDGKTTTAFDNSNENEAYASAVQTDGKIIAGGYTHAGSKDIFAIARYNTDGSLDNSFGSSGKITLALRNDRDYIRALAIQPDGKIIAGGSSFGLTGDDFALARFNADGSLDRSFGDDGMMIHVIGKDKDDVIHKIIIQPDNKILVAGTSKTGPNIKFVLSRYNSDGSVDINFGLNGITVRNGGGENIADAALLNDGKILLAGTDGTDFMTSRYLNDGNLDESFGKEGNAYMRFNVPAVATTIAVQPDNKIVLGGYITGDIGSDIAVARLLPSGLPDITFSEDGKHTQNVNGNDFMYAMKYSGQRIYLGGVSNQVVFTVAAFQTGSIILPLHLVDLIAVSKNKTTELKWQTSYEKNTALFEVHQGISPENFKTIGTVKSRGNSSTLTTYTFTDDQSPAGRNFYRLKMIDTDGRYTYSKTIVVETGAIATINIYPNPVQNKLCITVQGLKTNDYSWYIRDINGKKIITGKIATNTGIPSTTQINLGVLSKGTYIISIENSKDKKTQLFIKQ